MVNPFMAIQASYKALCKFYPEKIQATANVRQHLPLLPKELIIRNRFISKVRSQGFVFCFMIIRLIPLNDLSKRSRCTKVTVIVGVEHHAHVAHKAMLWTTAFYSQNYSLSARLPIFKIFHCLSNYRNDRGSKTSITLA